MRRSGTTVVCAGLVVLALVAAANLFQGLAGPGNTDWGESLAFGTAALVSAAVGLVVGLKRPGNVIGWLLIAQGALIASSVFAEGYARYAVLGRAEPLAGGAEAAAWSSGSWPALFAGIVAIAFVFPDGRLPSRRWRRAALLATFAFVGLLALLQFDPEPFEAPFEDVAKPYGELPEAATVLFPIFVLGVLASIVAAVRAVRTRHRRADGAERLQIRWLAWSTLLIPATILVCLADLVIPGELVYVYGPLLLLAEIAVPVAIGFAVLRYRLYEIDRVVNRTLVYGALTASVVALYTAVVLGLGALFDGDSLGVTLVGTGVVAVAVQPLRSILQRRVNRLLYGDRDDPYAALSRLGERLQADAEPRAVLGTVAGAVAEALRVPYVAIRLAGAEEVASSHGTRGRGEQLRLPLAFHGEPVGELLVESRSPGEPLGPADMRLLDDLAHHAAAAARAVRLTADLQRSRERLVLAREEERRRLRRDLHDGLGPTLAGVVLQLDGASALVREDPGAAETQLSGLRETVQDAIADIRRLVYELRPPALDELGLVPAIREHAARLNGDAGGTAIRVDAPALADLPAAVEVAAYRIALEAITNVSRHADARECQVKLSLNGGLMVEVTDDGTGLDGSRPGVGIASMRERATELGGTLTVTANPAHGTCVRAVLPLGPA